jgi:hypothetical protein
LVIAYAYLVAKGTEFRTSAVRDWAMRILMKQERPAAKTTTT